MKVEKLIENRIEKSLDLVENNPSEVVEVLNTNEVTQPAVINGGESDTEIAEHQKAVIALSTILTGLINPTLEGSGLILKEVEQ